MEKKIEISEKVITVGNGYYHTSVKVDGKITFTCYGTTPSEAQASARIAASGYLVEELVNGLSEAKLQIEYLNGRFGQTGTSNSTISRIKSLLTKAKTV